MIAPIRPVGPSALLVETGPTQTAALAQGAAKLEGVIDVVVGAQTVLISYDTGERSEQAALDYYTSALRKLSSTSAADDAEQESVTIPVRYDGEDLTYVAGQLGTDVDGVVNLHCSAEYRVGFMGFAPGFGYLEGLPKALQLPRRSTPRTRVPAGSLGIAGAYSAIYPGASPGGWLLLGHTDVKLFNPSSEPPALLRPGLRVKFDPQ